VHSKSIWNRDHDFAAPPELPAQDGDRLTIGPDLVELRRAHGPQEAAVRTVGATFYVMAVMAALFGNPWVLFAILRVTIFDRIRDWPGGADWLSSVSRILRWEWVENETLQLFFILAPAVVYTVVMPYLFFCIGRGVRRLSPLARTGALLVLGLACLASLMAFLISLQFEAYLGIVGALLTVIAPAVGISLLSATRSRILFSPKYRAVVAAVPGWWPALGFRAQLAGKGVLILWGLGVLFILGVAMG
jgi:hypothetical protein